MPDINTLDHPLVALDPEAAARDIVSEAEDLWRSDERSKRDLANEAKASEKVRYDLD